MIHWSEISPLDGLAYGWRLFTVSHVNIAYLTIEGLHCDEIGIYR
jgi:hypothetical protein